MELDSTKPLITYVSALIIFSFALLKLLLVFFFKDDSVFSEFEPLITFLSALIAFILVQNLRGAMEFRLSLVIAVITVAILAWMFGKLAANKRLTAKTLSILAIMVVALILVQNLRGAMDFGLSLVIAVITVAILAWMFGKLAANKRLTAKTLSILAIMVVFVFLSTLLLWNDHQNNIYGETIKVMLHTRKPYQSKDDVHPSARWEWGVAREFKEKFGATVEIVPAEIKAEERLKQILEPPEKLIDDVDVFAVDVIWPGVLTDYAKDLKPFFKNLDEFIPAIVKNNTVNNKLVAVPWFVDAGLLFYRKSLLEKIGENQPPETWDELEDMAKKIQQKERDEGNKNFWGFVWQGKAYEGLTCNALEWQYSHGGGNIVDDNNNVYIIEDLAVDAFEQAKNWIWKDKISPPDFLTKYDEPQTLQTWLQGKAAFMRAWPNAYLASSQALPNDVQATLLPRGGKKSENPGARHASTLGGWQLMVNTHSKGKKEKAAIKFVKFLTSEEKQLSLMDELGQLPAMIKLYNVASKSIGFIENARIKELFIGNSLGGSVARRPSTSTGTQYPKISEAYFKRVHEILENENSNVREVVEALQNDVRMLLPAKP